MHRAFKIEWSDVQVVTLAVSATFLIEDEDDMVVCNGIKRRHQYWMAPYLRDSQSFSVCRVYRVYRLLI